MQQVLSTIDDVLDMVLMQAHPPSILLGEDDDALREVIAAALRADGYDLVEARSGVDLIRAIHRIDSAMLPLDLIITDVLMPGFTGIEALEYLRYIGSQVPVIVMTGSRDPRMCAEARDLDARVVFQKPFALDDLRDAVARIVPRQDAFASRSGASASRG